MKASLSYLHFGLLISLSHAFYVPGIAPREFSKGSRIGELLVMMLANPENLKISFLCRSESCENDIDENAVAV